MIGAKIMSDDNLSGHVAISSNESELHASLKDPKLINVTWFIGKRCNFDCSYCSSTTHDNFSPHIKLADALNFINNLDRHCSSAKKKFKLNYTGGEPFVHPHIIKILEHCSKKENMYQQGLVTNGSLPLDVYQQAIKFLNNITISVHFEQTVTNIEKLIEKIIILNENKNIFLNVNVMALPGKFDQVERVIKKLSDNSVKFILKKIDPPNKEKLSYFYKGNTLKKDIQIIDNQSNLLDIKRKNKEFERKLIMERQNQYYNQQELVFFEKHLHDNEWPNLKLHFDAKKKILINSEKLKKKNLNKWKNWICFIGIESLYIEYDGSIYRGLCMQGDKLGNISDEIDWPTEPLVCDLDYCVCAADMCTKKVKNKKYLDIFDE